MRTTRPTQATITFYTDAVTGRRVPKGTPGAVHNSRKSDMWYAKINGFRVPLQTADEATAWAKLREIQKASRETAAGIRDTYTDAAALPIVEHIDAWLKFVEEKGASEAQLSLLRTRIRYLAGLAGWKRLSDINAESCLSALHKLHKQKFTKDGLTRSAQTRNHYLSHAKQFARFLWETDRLPKHVLLRLHPVSVEDDIRHERRSPSDEEIAIMHAAAPNQPIKRGMTGEQRMLGYRVAMATGLRANELRSLARDSFDLPNRAIWLRAAYDKRKKRTRQPIPGWLAAELQEWFDDGGGLWSGFTKQNPGRLLKEDLIAAGIPPCIEGPDGDLFFDFHSLRHWYCTWAANLPGISPKSLMTLCRHSTPALTMKIYAKARIHDLEAAVDQMPTIQPESAGISPSKPDEQSAIS